MTSPMQVDYQDVLRVWCEVDTIPDIEHAWLFDLSGEGLDHHGARPPKLAAEWRAANGISGEGYV